MERREEDDDQSPTITMVTMAMQVADNRESKRFYSVEEQQQNGVNANLNAGYIHRPYCKKKKKNNCVLW